MRNPLVHLRRLALVLVGLTLPFEHTVLASVVIRLTPNKLVTLLLVLVAMLQWVTERRRLPRDVKRAWVVFFGVGVGVSAVQSILAGVDIDSVRRALTTVYSLLLFYFVLSYIMRTRKDLDLLLGSFAVGVVLAVISGWVGFGAQYEGVRASRLAGEGGSPNLLAFNLLVAIAGAASLYFSARSPRARTLVLGLLGLMLAGVVATLSRSAYVALPGMAVLWAQRFRRVGLVRYAAPALLLVALTAMLAPPSAVERASTLAPERLLEDESARGRLQMFPDSFRAFASNPLTGVGLVGYIPWAVEHGTDPSGIHSAFLWVLAENGLAGFVPFVLITVLSWRELTRAWRTARRHRARRDTELRILELRSLALQIGLAGALVMSLAQPSTYHKSLWLLFALSTVVLGMVRERVRQIAPAQEPSPAGWDPGFASQPTLSPRFDAPR